MATRLYGLFERIRGTRKWTRVYPDRAYGKDIAVRVFQNNLLSPYLNPDLAGFEFCLKPLTNMKG